MPTQDVFPQSQGKWLFPPNQAAVATNTNATQDEAKGAGGRRPFSFQHRELSPRTKLSPGIYRGTFLPCAI